MEKLIITCAITGAETTKAQCPTLPITPEEQGEAAFECWQAGASVIHLHVRDTQGRPCQAVEQFQKTILEIRKRCPVIIQISTGGAVGETMANRTAPLTLKPDMASLNMGSINFGDEVFQNLPREIDGLAQEMYRLGVVPELEVYDFGMVEYTAKLIKKGTLKPPFHFQFVLGTPQGMTGEPRNICMMADAIPVGSSWAVAGIGRFQLPAAAQAIVMGGHVRVGFEDNIYWSKGVLAKSNAQLVARIKSLAETLQRPVATVEEARKMLGLNSQP